MGVTMDYIHIYCGVSGRTCVVVAMDYIHAFVRV